MKKMVIGLCFMFFVMMAGTVFGAPFITCDDPIVEEQIVSYIMTINGDDNLDIAAPLRVDCGDFSDGNYIITVRAVNVWGEISEASAPLNFTKALPSIPTGVVLSVD